MAGVSLCIAGAVVVYFEYITHWFYFIGGLMFVVGSVLDILDGARAAQRQGHAVRCLPRLDRRQGGRGLHARRRRARDDAGRLRVGVQAAFAAIGARSRQLRVRAEALGLKGDVGIGSRAERVILLSVGLGSPRSTLVLPITVTILAATAWITVAQRVLISSAAAPTS